MLHTAPQKLVAPVGRAEATGASPDSHHSRSVSSTTKEMKIMMWKHMWSRPG
jgi:hypothetical protein